MSSMKIGHDQVADKNRSELVRLSKQYQFPDFVKVANLDQTMSPVKLPAHLYADPRPGREQFPCHTAASTWLSTLYFTEKRAEFHPKDVAQIERRLEHYVNYWRIKTAIDYIKQRWQELHKEADDKLPDSMYAYVFIADDGKKERRLRLKTAAEVKAAADWLYQYRDRIIFSDRHKIAKNIIEKAAAYGVGLVDKRDFIDKQAGRGVGDPAEIVSMIENRARLIPQDRGVQIKIAEDGKEERTISLRDQFIKMAEVVKNTPRKALQPGMLIKLCETMDMLDRQQGFISRYENGISRPEDIIFKATFSKVAEELVQHVATTDGKVYDKEQLSKVSVDDLSALFGTDFVDRVTNKLGNIDLEKLAEEIRTLPRPDASLLEGLLREQGITPVLTKGASGISFSEEEKKAWAQAYATVK